MRAVVQRCHHARVIVDHETVGRVGPGAVVFLGVLAGDDPACARRLAEKIARFRFFEDDRGRMGRSILDLDGHEPAAGLLVVSQFTLAADGRKGRRPSFDRAARPEAAEPLYEAFCGFLSELGVHVQTGRFGAEMTVDVSGDGPVTFVLDEPFM